MNYFRKISLVLFCLVAFSPAFAERITLTKSQIANRGIAKPWLKNGSIRIKFDEPGWESGVKVLPPEGEKYWNFKDWKVVCADVKNLSNEKQLRMVMFLKSKDKNTGKWRDAKTGVAVNPGETRTLKLLIPHRYIQDAPKGVSGYRIIDSDRIESIDFYLEWTFEGKEKGLVDCAISNIRLEQPIKDGKKIPEDKFFPFIDVYGQNMHQDWPEKIKSDADLVKNHKQELKELGKSKLPAEWNRFGGWKNGPKLKATGSFRTEKYKGKWYLVDPDGRLFFSHGLDVLYTHTDATKTKDHDKWFASKIPANGSLAFTDTNLAIKYGKKDYASDFYDVLAKRMSHWGFNSIGNWGNRAFLAKRKMPYTMQLTDYDWRMPRIKNSKLKFYDVFDQKYIDGMKNLIDNASKKYPFVKTSLTDPLCIGYFIDNELNFGNRKEFDLIKAVIKSPAEQAMKKEFVSDLKAKYRSIKKLNKAWKTEYAGWQKLLDSQEVPEMNKKFKKDALKFTEKAINQYFRICRDAIKTKAPNRLYLGCRFIGTDGVRPMLYNASQKYCDVLTANVYSHSVANYQKPDFPDMPVMIGEFHFGIYDSGMFNPGLCPAGLTQEDRALAYTRFMQGALVNPRIVGAHWFQFRDQPLTGRWDGEGYQIGFVDVADTPYQEMIKASREIGEYMYQYRLNGKLNNEMRK